MQLWRFLTLLFPNLYLFAFLNLFYKPCLSSQDTRVEGGCPPVPSIETLVCHPPLMEPFQFGVQYWCSAILGLCSRKKKSGYKTFKSINMCGPNQESTTTYPGQQSYAVQNMLLLLLLLTETEIYLSQRRCPFI